MIIISETKKEHYLIKQFLNETRDPSEFYARTDWKAISDEDNQDTLVDEPIFIASSEFKDEDKLNKIIKNKPKYSGIKNLAKKGLLTLSIASSLFAASKINSSPELNKKEAEIVKQIEKQAKDKNVSINSKEIKLALNSNDSKEIKSNEQPQNIKKSIEKEDKPKISNKVEAVQSSDTLRTKSIERIKKFERFKPFPYQDEEGVSVGYGTQFITKGNANKIDSNWKDTIYNKIGYSTEKIEKVKEDKNYKSKTEKELNKYISKIENRIDELEKRKNKKVKGSKKYHFPKSERERLKKSIENIKTRIDAANDRGIILHDEAVKCLEIDIDESIAKAKEDFGKSFDKMDEEIQTVIVDMYYNLGLYFLKVHYKDLNKHLKNYSKELLKEKPDKKILINHLSQAVKEISSSGAPKYYRQNKKRATENYNLFKKAIQNLKNSLRENKSLKNIYNNLFS